jgi:hypothetical protein
MLHCYIVTLLIIILTLAVPVCAQNFGVTEAGQAATQGGYAAGTNETTLAETVGIVIKATLSLVGAIFLALMVYAGFLWMTAYGEEEPITKAKKIITASIIGIVIVVGAYSLTDYIIIRIYSSVNPATTMSGDVAPLKSEK